MHHAGIQTDDIVSNAIETLLRVNESRVMSTTENDYNSVAAAGSSSGCVNIVNIVDTGELGTIQEVTSVSPPTACNEGVVTGGLLTLGLDSPCGLSDPVLVKEGMSASPPSTDDKGRMVERVLNIGADSCGMGDFASTEEVAGVVPPVTVGMGAATGSTTNKRTVIEPTTSEGFATSPATSRGIVPELRVISESTTSKGAATGMTSSVAKGISCGMGDSADALPSKAGGCVIASGMTASNSTEEILRMPSSTVDGEGAVTGLVSTSEVWMII